MTILSSATSFLNGDPSTPEHFNRKLDPIIGSIQDLDDELGDRGLSVTALGVSNDGTDSGTSLAVILSTYSNIYFPPGRYGTSVQLSARSYQRLRGAGSGLVSIEALDSLQTILAGSFLSSFEIEGLTLNVKGATRTSITAGLVALSIRTASDVVLRDVVIDEAFGPSTGGSSAAIGLSIVDRVHVDHVVIHSLGSYERPNDGIYAKGTKVRITHSIAEACSDTGFVLEGCTDSSIEDSTATGCAAGYAISAATGTDGAGCRLSNCILSGWSAPNTGGIQIGSLGSCVLRNIDVDGLTAIQQSTGTGSMMFVRTTGPGVLGDVMLRGLTVEGTMAYIVQATGVVGMTISQVQSRITGLANFSIGSGCSDIDISLVRSRSTVSFGVFVSAATDVLVHNNNLTGLGNHMQYGVYFDSGCSRVQSKWNEIRGATQLRTGQVSGIDAQVMDLYPNSGGGGVRFGTLAQGTLFVASEGSHLLTDSPFHSHLVHTEGIRSQLTMVIGNYTVTSRDQMISVNSSSTVTVTLPNPSSVTSQIFSVKRFGTETVVVQATSGASLDGSATLSIATQYSTVEFQSYGSGYLIR